jgi:hypothetical protein
MAKDRAHDPNRKFNLPRVDSAYNFMQYTGPEDYTEDERVKSLELIKDLNKKLDPEGKNPWNQNRGESNG